jgi:hypothetical protein
MARMILLLALLFALETQPGSATEVRVVRPVEIDELLVDPGIGLTTFQRFNGDALNEGAGWTEGRPIEYQEFDGDLRNDDYPMTSRAYFRFNWRFLEPRAGEYAWALIDRRSSSRTPTSAGGCPGTLYDESVFLPPDLPEGGYELEVGTVDPRTRRPRVRLAIEGRDPEGWYSLGPISVERGPFEADTKRRLDIP